MNEIRKSVAFFCLWSGFVFLLLPLSTAHGEIKGHDIWTQLLVEFVKDGQVNYQGFKTKENLLDEYLHFLDSSDPSSMSRQDQLAFYINGYNAYTVKLILKNFKKDTPPSSIKKIGGLFSGPWSIRFAGLGGKKYTLDNIEHDILRPTFKEPRIHFAVNCASKGCPPLLAEAYVGEKLEEQLSEVTKAFLSDETRNYLTGNTLYVSKIFSWFKEDFKGGIVSFFMKHGDDKLTQRLNQAGVNTKVEYLPYDWELNN